MIDLVVNAYKKKVASLKNDRLREEVANKFLEEAADLVTDRPDSNGWVRRYQVNDWEKGHLQANQLEVVRKSREFDRWDPHAHGILGTLVNYIMGRGLTLQPKADDPMIWWIWRDFFTDERNKMALKQFEIVRRTFRDGEVFMHLISKDDTGRATGKTTIRFIDPLLVRAPMTGKDDLQPPNESIRNGVVTDPEDVENVMHYTVLHHIDRTKFDKIPADEIVHIKLNADSDQKRGEPGMQTLLQYFRHYEQWLENRIILNKVRAAIVLIKKVEGTPTEVSTMARTIPVARRNTANETKLKNIRGGTMITEGPGVTYRFESPNINAADVKEDGRNVKLAMAAGVNIPEYLLGDASNANYASTMIAESPFVKMIQFYQFFFEFHFQRIYKKVIQNAVKAGLADEPNDDEFLAKLKQIRTLAEAAPADSADKLSPRETALKELMPNGKMEMPTEIFYGCDMSWPEIIHRDIKEQADALAVVRQAGWISDATACASLGYDYNEEVRKQRQVEEDAEIEENPLLAVGGAGDAGDMAGEMNDLIGKLSPEERQTVLNSKDPKEVQGIMAKHQNGAGGDSSGQED